MLKITRGALLLSVCLLARQASALDDATLTAEMVKLYDQKKFAETAALFEQEAKARKLPMSLYVFGASCHALAGDKQRAFQALDQAVERGLLDLTLLESDRDFESLHPDPRWKALLERIRKAADLAFPATWTEVKIVKLPAPALQGSLSVERALAQRRSRRIFTAEPLTLAQVSQILWAAYGITEPRTDGPATLRGGLRTAPSAGARYPLELYLVAGQVKDLPAGVYRYRSEDHTLALLRAGDIRAQLDEVSLQQIMVAQAPATVVWSAIFERNMSKYGPRGRERYVCMDLGHSGQNVYLQVEALGLGTCAIGAFMDLQVKALVGMTKAEEPLYLMPFGHVPPDAVDKP